MVSSSSVLISDQLNLLHQDESDTLSVGDLIQFGPDLFLGTHGRQCVKTSTSNDCLLAHFKHGV